MREYSDIDATTWVGLQKTIVDGNADARGVASIQLEQTFFGIRLKAGAYLIRMFTGCQTGAAEIPNYPDRSRV
jgi:hypothetical protein